MNKTAWMLVGWVALVALPAQALDDRASGLNSADQSWSRWQGRVSFGTAAPAWRPALITPDFAFQKLGSLSLMGDYYLSRPITGPGSVGGLRATGGVILGPRSTLWASQPGASSGGAFSIGNRLFGQTTTQPYNADAVVDNATVPYMGLGYTGLSARNGWSFSADLGLVAQYPGNVARLGRGQSLDDVVRELRLAPVLQVGVSYSF